jgi:hypothetical protein
MWLLAEAKIQMNEGRVFFHFSCQLPPPPLIIVVIHNQHKHDIVKQTMHMNCVVPFSLFYY